jgi:preprotein translocase subunit SecF
MEFFRDTKIDFIGKRNLYFFVSILMTAVAVYAFVVNKGPVLGIEFTGGTLVQVGFEKDLPNIEDIRHALNSSGWQNYGLQTQPANKTIQIRVKEGDKSKEDISAELLSSLRAAYPGNAKDHADRVEFIGPAIGKHLIADTFKAIFGSLVLILIYVAWRFTRFIWGFSGVLALAHDVFIAWGFLTLLGHETTLVIVAALLTLAGYSINDTIVVFDRVREELRSARKESVKEIYNRALNETLGRTINTSLTTFIASMSLYLLGGEVIRDFSLVMAFGILIGTYSSVGVALSLVYTLEAHDKKGGR